MRIVAILLWPFTWLYAHSSFVRGFVRLIGILVGWKAESSQEVATNLLIIMGFAIEGYLLVRVISDSATKDFRDLEGFSTVMPLLVVLLALVIFVLLFHQFVIFRNFSLPREVARRDARRAVDAEVQNAILALQQGNNPQPSIDALRNVPQLTEVPLPAKGSRAILQKGIEIVVYLLFGVLTGEAGYSLTILHEHTEDHWTAKIIEAWFGTAQMPWGVSLGCAFLACATLICGCVFAWDLVVVFSRKARALYGNSLVVLFVLNDILSGVFWLCLFIIVTPRARFFLGVRYDPFDLGYCALAWGILVLCSVFYIAALGYRFVVGLKALAAEPRYLDSRFKEI